MYQRAYDAIMSHNFRPKEETGLIAERLELYATAFGKEMRYIYPNQDKVFTAESVLYSKIILEN